MGRNLREVIILDNAITYSPTGSKIEIESNENDGRAIITIQDHGVGIPPKDLPHIFERFYRASRSRTRNMEHGFGLGLSIARSIMIRNNGEIDIKSIIGEGTRAVVTLPKANLVENL